MNEDYEMSPDQEQAMEDAIQQRMQEREDEAILLASLTVPLTQGKVSIIDEIDSWVLQFRWYARYNRYWHAIRNSQRNHGKRRTIILHRQILIAATGSDRPDMYVDHKNGDTLDNRRCNLRWSTRSENGRNRSLDTYNTSGILGVSWHKKTEKWVAQITVNGRNRYLGVFKEINDAVAARRKAETQFYGEFSSTLSRPELPPLRSAALSYVLNRFNQSLR